jgi:hypothetical protein
MLPNASVPKRNFCIFNLHKSGNEALHNGRADYVLLYVYREGARGSAVG